MECASIAFDVCPADANTAVGYEYDDAADAQVMSFLTKQPNDEHDDGADAAYAATNDEQFRGQVSCSGCTTGRCSSARDGSCKQTTPASRAQQTTPVRDLQCPRLFQDIG